MHRAPTTVIALIGSPESAIESLRHKANVMLYQPDPSTGALGRAAAAWEVAKRSHATYFVHDADPLIPVAESWGRYFEGAGLVGELEATVGETLARWRAGSLELPDYYVLWSPEDWPPVRRHWYLGLLADACPARVVNATTPVDLPAKLAGLPAGRWWPELDRLLAGIERRVPDGIALAGAENSASSESAGLLTPGRRATSTGN
jgi:hypothetical protein